MKNQEAAKKTAHWTANDPSVLMSPSGLFSSCTLRSLPCSLDGVCTFSHGDVLLELLCTSNIFLFKVVLMDHVFEAIGTS